MSRDLFEKIVDDCSEFELREMEPFLQGEPFSDPHILERLEYARDRLPRTHLRIYTNGYALTQRTAYALIQIGIDELVVSVNSLDPTRYQETMGLKLSRTLKNIEYILAPLRRKDFAAAVTLRMTILADTSLEEQDAFLEYCKKWRVKGLISGVYNYKGDIRSGRPVPRYGCEHVTRLDILASGAVALCCMDHNGQYGWGTAREMSVLELYNHPVAKRYRKLHSTGRRRQVDPCAECNLFWPSFQGTSLLERIRTGLEFTAYRARYTTTGRRTPTLSASEATLGQLRSAQLHIPTAEE